MRISRLRRSCTRLYKTSMLRRLVHKQDVLRRFHFQCPLLHRISSYRTFRASNLTRRVSFCCRSFDTFCANFCLFWFKLKSLFEVFNSSLTAEAIRLTVVLCPSRVAFILDRLFPFGGVTTSTFRQLIREGSTAPRVNKIYPIRESQPHKMSYNVPYNHKNYLFKKCTALSDSMQRMSRRR